MVRGKYPMQDVETKPTPKDSSYKSCIISMFIVFLLCIIIILIFWQTKSDSGHKYKPLDDASKQAGSKLDAYVNAPPTFASEPTSSPVTTMTVPLATMKYNQSKGHQNFTTGVTGTSFVTQPVGFSNFTSDNVSLSTENITMPGITTPYVTNGTINSTMPGITTPYVTNGTINSTMPGITTPYVTNGTINSTMPSITTSYITNGTINSTMTSITTPYITNGTINSTTPRIATPYIANGTINSTMTSITTPYITNGTINSTTPDITTPCVTNETSVPVANAVMSATTVTVTETIPIGIVISHEDNKTCQTSECKVLASRMLSLMNHSVDPCDNFYEFACGGLRENYALLQEDPAQDVWHRIASAAGLVNANSSIVHQKFRYLYDRCVNYEHTVNESVRLALAQKIVGEVDNIYNNSEWEEADKIFNFTNLLIKLFNLDSAPLFDVSMDVNPHDTTKFQLKLTVPRSKSKLQLESPSVTRCKSHIKYDDPHHIDMKLLYDESYLTCIRNFSVYFTTLETAVMDLGLFGKTDTVEVMEHIANITSFIQTDVFSPFQEIVPWTVRVNTLEKKFTLKTVEELQTQYPEVNWEVLLSALLRTTVDGHTQVQMYFENYFDKLFRQLKVKLLDSSGRSVIHNGLLAMLAHDIYEDLVKPHPCDREDYCLRTSSALMEDVSSSLYLSTFTSKELSDKEHELVTLFEQLKNVLSEEINGTSWLEQEARDSLLDKLNHMSVTVHGSTSILLKTGFLNSLFLNHLNLANNYFENAVELLRQYRKTLYQHSASNPRFPQAVLYFCLPFDTHPVSVYELNTVIIPLGVIGSTNKLSSFVLQSRISNEIARQIVHHFDTTGIKYNTTGCDDDFLKGISLDSYVENFVKCEEIFNYQNFTWTSQRNQIYTYQVNAARTMNEHFTDNSALWLTHKLFNKTVASEPVLPWLERSHDQLYLLLAAQEFCAEAELEDYTVAMFETEHSAPHLRVKNMMERYSLFSDVYKCVAKATNNSSKKCAAFPGQV